MASFTNDTKHTDALVNQDKTASLTFDEADFAWEDAGQMTWNDGIRYINQDKNSSSTSNQTKH